MDDLEFVDEILDDNNVAIKETNIISSKYAPILFKTIFRIHLYFSQL